MRTTLDLNDELLRRAKRRAANEGEPLRGIVEKALRSYLAGPAKRGNYVLRWRTERGRVLPGVRLDDREALWDQTGRAGTLDG